MLLNTLSSGAGLLPNRLRKSLERETGIEPATNSLEGCDSTTELLPPYCSESASRRVSRLPCLVAALTARLEQNLELTERLELSTSPLPRECSTTELRQPETTNLTILSRTQPPEYDAKGKKSQQDPRQRSILPRLHR